MILGIPLVLGGLVLAAQGGLPPATSDVTQSSPEEHVRIPPMEPPTGQTWIVGVVTDQADHAQDNVNIEAWGSDPGATAPVASALTYGGPPDNPTYAHGYFLLQVPSDQSYRILFSAVTGKEDGDAFRMQQYGHGRPIMVRGLARATGRTRDLGTIALARQGKVTSTTRTVLSHAKVTPPKRAKVRVKVRSPFVTNVTGKVTVRVAGKRVVEKLTSKDHGKATLRLPRVRRAGAYKVKATFVGSSTVHRSKAKPIKLTVRRRK